MVGLKQVDRLIGLVSLTILARLLLPEDFGIVVYATALVAIFEMFFQFGFETVLIRDQNAGSDKYNTAWTLKIVIGMILSAMLILGAPYAASYFGETKVETVLYWIAASPLIRGFENIGVVDFQKNMEFDREFKFKFSTRVVGTISTIALAYQLQSYWALVYGTLINNALGLVLSFVMSDYRPRLCLKETSRVFGFSKWLLVQNLLNSLTERLPVFALGRYFDAQTVAFYNMGHELSNMATGEIAAPIRRALFPGVMSIANDEKKMVETIIATISVIGFIGLPISIGIGQSASIAIPLLLGDKWSEIVPVLQILAFYAASMSLYSNSHVIYYAQNKPYISTIVTATRLALIIPSFVFVLPEKGIVGAAWAWTLSNILVTAAEYLLFYKMVSVRVADIINAVWRSIVGVVCMGFFVNYIVSELTTMNDRLPLLIEFGIVASSGAITYGVVVFGTWWLLSKPRGAESFIVGFVAEKLA